MKMDVLKNKVMADIPADIINKWNQDLYSLIYLNKFNKAPWHKRNYFLSLTQFERNKFTYIISSVGKDECVGYNWNYYACSKNLGLTIEKCLYNFPLSDIISIDRINWRTFQDKQYPRKNSLVFFKVLLDSDNNDLHYQEIYHLGIFKSFLFQKHFIPTVSIEKLISDTYINMPGVYDTTVVPIKNVKKFKKIPFKAIYKWTYLSEILDKIGDPIEFKLGLINYEKKK